MANPHERQRTVRDFLDRAYARGSVLDEQAEPRKLAPHSLERHSGEALRHLARSEGAIRTIEVGLALGVSALFLGQAVLETGGRHTAIDPFQEASWGNAGLRTIKDAGVEDIVEVLEDESQLVLPRLVSEGRTFDFAFIDGDHRFEGVFLDLYYMTRLVEPGRLVVVDDMWMSSVRMAVAYVERNLGATLEPEVLPNGFRWGRRRLRRGPASGTGEMAALRLPAERPVLEWSDFVAPY